MSTAPTFLSFPVPSSTDPADMATPTWRLSSLPCTIFSLISHHLHLRELLVWSTTNRLIRGIVCADLQPSTAPSRIAVAADCWRFIPTVQLRWGKKTPHLGEKDGVVSFELDGAIMPSVTANIKAALDDSLTITSQAQPTIADAFVSVRLSPDMFDSTCLPPAPPLPAEPFIPFPLIPSLAAMIRSLRFVRRMEYTQTEDCHRVLLSILTVLPSFPRLLHLALHYQVIPPSQLRSMNLQRAVQRDTPGARIGFDVA